MKIKDIAKINELSIGRGFQFTEIEYLDTSSVTDGFIEKTQILKLQDAPSRAKRIVRKNDILISTVRPNLRHFALIRNPKTNTVASTGFAVITCKNAYPQYLYRFLTTDEFTTYLSIIAESQQSNYPAFNPSLIEKVEINLPPVETQKKIAAVLSAYDDLIENNKRRIALLEKMAEEIYREWFVRMRFPGYKETKFEKGVPVGWKKEKLETAFVYTGGGTPSKEVNRYWENGTVNWFTPSDITAAQGIYLEESGDKCTEEGLSRSSARLFPAYSIMMTSRATIGAIGINTTPACTNQGFITCLPNEKYPLVYLYYWLKLAKPYFELLSTGATFAELTKGTFKKIEILNPPKVIVDEFEEKVFPLFKSMETLLSKNKKLSQTRDLLLSRLISGKLSVENLDIQFPPSMREEEMKAEVRQA